MGGNRTFWGETGGNGAFGGEGAKLFWGKQVKRGGRNGAFWGGAVCRRALPQLEAQPTPTPLDAHLRAARLHLLRRVAAAAAAAVPPRAGWDTLLPVAEGWLRRVVALAVEVGAGAGCLCRGRGHRCDEFWPVSAHRSLSPSLFPPAAAGRPARRAAVAAAGGAAGGLCPRPRNRPYVLPERAQRLRQALRPDPDPLPGGRHPTSPPCHLCSPSVFPVSHPWPLHLPSVSPPCSLHIPAVSPLCPLHVCSVSPPCLLYVPSVTSPCPLRVPFVSPL